MNKRWSWLYLISWLICLVNLMSMVVWGLFLASEAGVLTSNDINELGQDKYERQFGIVRQLTSMQTEWPLEKQSHQTILGGDLVCEIGPRIYSWYADGYRGQLCYWWNDSICGRNIRYDRFFLWQFFAITLAMVPALLAFADVLLLYLIQRRDRETMNWIFPIFSTMLGGSIMCLIMGCYYTPSWRNYTSSYESVFRAVQQNQSVLNHLLRQADTVQIVPVDFLKALTVNLSDQKLASSLLPLNRQQERHLHGGEVFISKRPIFPFDYIRINVDFANYLFWGKELNLADLKKINPRMLFIRLDKDIWLGHYDEMASSILRFGVAYMVALLCWLTGGFLCGSALWRYWRERIKK